MNRRSILWLIVIPTLIFSIFFGSFLIKPVFAQTNSTTVTYQIGVAGDDGNQLDANFDPNATALWFGTAGSAAGSYTGLHFNNLAIPKNATINSANFQVYSTSQQWISIGYDVFGDASGNSLAFSIANRPSDRSTTTAKVSHTSDTQWLANTWYSSDNISSVIQEIVNRPDWQSGNNLSLILHGTVGTWGRKNAASFDSNPTFAPKLVITFQDSSGLPAPIITNVNSSSVTTNSAIISWNSDVAADSQVDYGTTTAYGNSTTLDPTLVTSHSKSLTNLSQNVIYHYRVKSRGQNGVQSTSPDFTFTTPVDTSTVQVGQWSQVINWPLVAVHMALMPTGQVLMWDAWELSQTPSARLWNPLTQTFASVPNPNQAMFCAAQTMLPDGKQLVIGGHNGSGIGIKNTSIFDFQTSSWSKGGDMNFARWYPSSVALSDGRVLTLGGSIDNNINASTPEVFSEGTNSWTSLPQGQLNVGEYPSIFLSPNGKVFMVAGASVEGDGVSDGLSRYFDVNSQTWQTLGSSPVTSGTSVMYQPGKILTSGGSGTVDSKTAVIDLNQPNPAWRVTSPMNYGRFLHNLVVLPDGKVLAIGGSNTFSLVSTTGILQSEVWDPQTETWSTLVPMQNLRMYHSASLLLPDGRVLAAGGGRLSPANDYLTAEIYSPSYLFKGTRPTISNAPVSAGYSSSINIDTPDASTISKVSLIRLSSVTHAFNMDQRFIPLSFTPGSNSLSVQTPSDANIAPPGYYMLFILNAQNIPSVSKIIQIGGASPSSTPSPSVSPTATPTPSPSPSPTPTPTPTPLPSSTPTPTPAPTQTPAPTSTPAPTASPTPAPTAPPGTMTKQVNSSSDDANQDGTTVTLNSPTDWTGVGASTTQSFTGLRFTGITIPKGAIITSATLQVFSSQSSWITNNFSIGIENIGNSPTFSTTNKPSQRVLTATISHADNVQWNANTWYTLNDMTSIVQTVINRADWQSGNALSVVLKGSGSAYSRKFVTSFDGSAVNAPKLVITYH